MSFKNDKINDLALNDYHDISNLNRIKDPEKCQSLANDISDLLNESELSTFDIIQTLKNITFQAIRLSCEDFMEYQEKNELRKMQEDMK